MREPIAAQRNSRAIAQGPSSSSDRRVNWRRKKQTRDLGARLWCRNKIDDIIRLKISTFAFAVSNHTG